MKKNNKIFSDLSKLVGSAVSTTTGIKDELVQLIKMQVEGVMMRMDFVKREEFEIVRKIAIQNKKELEELKKQINKNPEKLK